MTYLEAVGRYGSIRAAAREMGLNYSTFHKRVTREAQDPAIGKIMDGAGTGLVPSSAWLRTEDSDGNKVTVHLRPDATQAAPIREIITAAIAEAFAGERPQFEPRTSEATGAHLLIVDLADVHFLKLCVKSETGYTYNRDIARHRVIEGTRMLLAKAKGFGVARILFVLGNDILHIDNAQRTTTSGTRQDTDGSPFQGFTDAYAALTEAIIECAKVADVDLIHCMSNHDWVTGWALSQAVAAGFAGHPNVNASAYSMSEVHRKYYRFGANLFVLTHGDGAKEEKLLPLMAREARVHFAECPHRTALLHHVHHKIVKRRGLSVMQTEKDHAGMSFIESYSEPMEESEGLKIEYVRSPSSPDGWHDRNGFVNRQGVEAFLHHTQAGAVCRFTEWF